MINAKDRGESAKALQKVTRQTIEGNSFGTEPYLMTLSGQDSALKQICSLVGLDTRTSASIRYSSMYIMMIMTSRSKGQAR